MLAIFRKGITAKIFIGVLALGLFAIVITGFGTGGIGGLDSLAPTGRGDTLASVEGRSLTEQEASDVINRQYVQARREQPDLDMGAFLNEAYEPLVSQLIVGLALQAFGEAQGLVVTPRMIDREIVNIPAFRNFTGQFDEATFRQALQSQNVTEAQLREDIGRQLMQRQLLGPVARGAFVPEGIAREYANLLLERRRGTIGMVPTEAMRAGIEPTPQQLAQFYQRSRARFTIPERRVVQYAMFGPEQVAEAARATEPEIAEFYRRNTAQFGPRETRTVQSIVLTDQAAAQAFVQRVRGGASFVDAAGQAGFSASDVTFADQTREQFAEEVPEAVANAAFSAPQGELAGPIRSDLGFHVVRVERIARTPGRPLAAVRDEIAQAIQQRKLGDALNDLVGRLEDRIADGASLVEAARAERLEVVTTPPITAAGQVPGQQWPMPPELQGMLTNAFEIDAEEPEPVIEEVVANQRFALLGLERVIPATVPPLAEIQAQVRETYIRQRAIERGRQVADQIVARIQGGMSPSQAFAQAQPRIEAPRAVNLQRLEISQSGQQAPAALVTLFSIPQGQAQIMAGPNGVGWIIVHHAERTPGNVADRPELIATTRAEFANSAAEELAQQFARAIELASEVERNEEAMQRTRRRLLGITAE